MFEFYKSGAELGQYFCAHTIQKFEDSTGV